MPLDPNIAMSYNPTVALDMAGAKQNALVNQALMQKNMLADQQAQQDQAQKNFMNDAYGRAYDPASGQIDYNQMQALAAAGGRGGLIPGMLNQRAERDKATWEANKSKYEAAAMRTQEHVNALRPSMTPNELLAWRLEAYFDPVLSATMSGKPDSAAFMDEIQRAVAKGPQAYQDLIASYAAGGNKHVAAMTMTAAERRPVAVDTINGVEGITPTGETVWTRGAPLPKPGVTINTGDKADLYASKAGVDSLMKTRESLAQAPTLWQNLEDARALIPAAKGFMGPGGELSLDAASFLNNRLGTNINVAGIKNATELRSRMFQGIISTLKQLDSNPSVSQQAALQSATGSIGTDPNAMGRVLDVTQDILSGRVARYNKDATKASEKLDFPFDMPIEMPTRKSATSTTPPPPPGFKITR